jgi:hypothetical protein
MHRSKSGNSRTDAPIGKLGPEGSLSAPRRVRDTRQLGAVIRAKRGQSHATLIEAAGLAGVGVRYLLELEHGKPTAALGKALQVLERFGLELWVAPRGSWPGKADD